MNALVAIREGAVRANSQDVAAAFDKEHRNVLRAIDQMIETSPELSRLNFEQRDFIKRGRAYRSYEMDRDGFSLLAMGFTGAKALEWKLKFLAAFKRMEEALATSLSANDNALGTLHPLLQTAEGRDAMWKGREQVRLMKELQGRAAAMALWLELGLPLPRNFDAMMDFGAKRELEAKPSGEMHAWIAASQVRANAGVARTLEELWANYFNWCFVNDLRPHDEAKFQKHLRIHFGAGSEIKRRVYAIECGVEQ